VLTFALVNLEDHADVGMVQRRRRLRLALEASESLCVFGNIVRQELQSHKAVEFYILRFVNNTHPAAAEFFDDTVMRDRLADHWAEMLGRRVMQVNAAEEVGYVLECQLTKHRHFTPLTTG
jgi:hypothetical protein